ncbi:MAG: hypothetical protein ACRCX2_24040 [Paraclostridium sp.]
MFYIRMKSNNTINWANAYKTHSEAVNDIRMMERTLGFELEWEVEYHDKGIYFASMTGNIFMDGFATRECALRWLYETYRVIMTTILTTLELSTTTCLYR